MQVMVLIRVSKETHTQLKKAQAILSGKQGKMLTLDETILQLCKLSFSKLNIKGGESDENRGKA